MQTTRKPAEHTIERKRTSILNDLDPENARPLHPPRPASGHLANWVAVLLLVAGILWFYLGATFDDKLDATMSTVRWADTPPSLTPLPPPTSTHALPKTAEGGSALIRSTPTETGKTNTTGVMQPDAFAALQEELAKDSKTQIQETVIARHSGTTNADQRTKQVPPSATKAAKRPADKGATISQQQRRSDQGAAERDINIISAIVK